MAVGSTAFRRYYQPVVFMQIGVLALQGDFAAHIRALRRLSASAREVRTPAELENLDALIIPGGESTTMLKLMTDADLVEPIKRFAAEGKPIFGTCAGAIVLARDVSNPDQDSLDLIDIGIERNAYGRQLDSFVGEAEMSIEGGPMEAVFIRAPRIRRTGPDVEILGRLRDEPVLVRQKNILAATFHPELSKDDRAHRLLLSQA
jgi:pyridoxal 5'-phosphate synthase pdxT subunit